MKLKPKEKLALTAFVLGLDSGQIELGNRNVDRQVTDALGNAPRPVSTIWIDSAMTKLGISSYYALAIRANELSKAGALTLKPQTDNRTELLSALTDRARMEQGQAPISSNFAAKLERDEKLRGY